MTGKVPGPLLLEVQAVWSNAEEAGRAK